MCTLLMIREWEKMMFLAAKTVDTPKTLLTFDRKSGEVDGFEYLFFKMGWQKGVNSGINERGLVILSSYAGTRLPANERLIDTRGEANEYILKNCSDVSSALQKLESYFITYPSEVGGIHFIMDESGKMGVLEHEPGIKLAAKTVMADYIIRANEPLLLKANSSDTVQWADRRLRYEYTESSLQGFAQSLEIAKIQTLLGSHLTGEEKQIGQLCIHDFPNEGSRSKDMENHSTETALIFDIKNRQMIYSDGPPCHHKWCVLAIEGS